MDPPSLLTEPPHIRAELAEAVRRTAAESKKLQAAVFCSDGSADMPGYFVAESHTITWLQHKLSAKACKLSCPHVMS